MSSYGRRNVKIKNPSTFGGTAIQEKNVIVPENAENEINVEKTVNTENAEFGRFLKRADKPKYEEI